MTARVRINAKRGALLARLICAAFLAALAAQPSAAQDRITPEAFLDLAVGKTLTFNDALNGNVVGVEQFLSPTRTVWSTSLGRCTYGKIETRENRICFIYEDNPNPLNCWTIFISDGTLLVRSTISGSVQRITAMTDKPVVCEEAPIS